jgi:signal transduction histidine kinase
MLRTERDVEVEFRVVRPDGSIRYIRGVSTPLPNAAGRPTEFVGTLIDITEQKRATARLVQVKRAARERTLRTQFEATLEERTRLARDIHDTLLQGVTGIALKLRATLPNLGAAPSATVESIRGIVELAEATIRDARRAVWDIRGSALARNGLPRALEEEARRRANGVDLHFTLRGEPRRIPGAFEDAIFRIGQEAVINAATHSAARSISVVLSYEPREVRLTVADDGRGFVIEPTEGSNSRRWGLIGMRERAERIDAPLVIRSGEGKGTTVELSVPLAGAEDRESAAAARQASRASSVEKATLHASHERADSRAHG